MLSDGSNVVIRKIKFLQLTTAKKVLPAYVCDTVVLKTDGGDISYVATHFSHIHTSYVIPG